VREITTQRQLDKCDFQSIEVAPFWNEEREKEIKMHRIHIYPAKFPSLIAQRSFEYAKHRCRLENVADIFCGCGTVAVEAKRKGLNFWGCDLNPVATLITEVKTTQYDQEQVRRFADRIRENYVNYEYEADYNVANSRLQYWFSELQYCDLYNLKTVIIAETPDGIYRKLFLCIFSSLLKMASKWLAKSVKPQIDPDKTPKAVLDLYDERVKYVLRAIAEVKFNADAAVDIDLMNVLDVDRNGTADMIVTSPPYVTSYEYADLHQLSSLWLDYTEDYTTLRHDSIGSNYGITAEQQDEQLTPAAQRIVAQFNPTLVQTRAIGKYYSDMQKFVRKSADILRRKGLVVYVIGDTEYRGLNDNRVRVENARCICECMLQQGFKIIDISKRAVQNKLLPSHRDGNGKFSSSKDDRAIYSQEYIIVGRKIG
jgi:methylase of polypeptide subunit release factors